MTFTTTENEDKKPLWNKGRHKVFRKQYDEMDSDEASADFDKIHDEQKGMYDKNGQLRIKFEDYLEFEVTRQGKTEQTIVQRRDIINQGGFEDQRKKMRRVNTANSSVSACGDSGGRRGVGATWQALSSAKRDALDILRGDRSEPDEDDVGPHDSASQLSSQPASTLKQANKMTRALSQIPPEKMSDKQFLILKDSLVARLAAVTEAFTLPKTGKLALLTAAQDNSDKHGCDQKNLTHKTCDIIAQITLLQQTNGRLIEQVEGLAKTGVAALLCEIDSHEGNSRQHQEQSVAHVEALKYKVEQKADKTRAVYFQSRYQCDKRAKTLFGGKHGKNVSRFCGKFATDIYAHDVASLGKNPYIPELEEKSVITVDPDKFDYAVPTIFTSLENVFVKAMVAHQASASPKVDTVLQTIAQCMKDNKTWPGALAPIGSASEGWDSGDLKAEHTSEMGAASWLMGNRKNARRVGPGAWPLPGVACMMKIMEAPMHIMLLRGGTC